MERTVAMRRAVLQRTVAIRRSVYWRGRLRYGERYIGEDAFNAEGGTEDGCDTEGGLGEDGSEEHGFHTEAGSVEHDSDWDTAVL